MMKLKFSFEYQEILDVAGLSDENNQLILKAIEACNNSYSPYSDFSVGAALLLENGEFVTGSNQENSAFPSGLCAERVAVFSAMHSFPGVSIKCMAIAAKNQNGLVQNPVTPCGACRQVMVEAAKSIYKPYPVLLYGAEKIIVVSNVLHLLPFEFDSAHLTSLSKKL